MGIFKDKSGVSDVPQSLTYNTYEMQNPRNAGFPPPSGPPPQYDTTGSATPYLGLRARLSQVWLNRWTILLLLILVRVLILVAGLHDNIGDAQSQALSACTKVEDIGSAMASMPHYLSVGVNDMAATGISKTVQGMVELLGMILTGVEQLIIFVINFYIGTYVCLSSALIHGGLDVGIGAADEVTKFMNNIIDDATSAIEDEVKSVQDTINSVFDKIKSAASLFGGDLNPPTIDFTSSLDKLSNIQVDDTSFVQTLKSLNTTIPTYDEAETFAKNAISIPFKAVKTVLNNTYGAYKFDTDVFPVAKKTPLTFCSGNDKISSFFESLYKLADRAKIGFIVVLVLLAIAACVPMTYWEIRRWRNMRYRAKMVQDMGGVASGMSGNANGRALDPMYIVYIANRPYTARFGAWLGSFRCFRRSEKSDLLARWAFAYATSFPALFVLSLALAGFLSCAFQGILLSVVQKEAPALASEVNDFADNVVTTLENVSTDWANDANGVLLNFQNEINNDVLGYVVNATSAVNHTLNVFTDEIADGINAVFNGTVLDNTVQQIVRCLIGIKIESIEEGLTWVHDHAHVTLPLFPNDTFSVGAKESISNDSSLTSFLSDPGSVNSDDITAAVDKVVTSLRHGVIQEALISTALLLIYLLVVLIGIVYALIDGWSPRRNRGVGGGVNGYYYPTADDMDAGKKGGDNTTDYAAAPVTTSREAEPYFPQFGNTAAVSAGAGAATYSSRKIPGSSGSGSGSSSSGGQRDASYEKNHWRNDSYRDDNYGGAR